MDSKPAAPHLQWIEPVEFAASRERFLNGLAIRVPGMLAGIALGAAMWSLIGSAIVRHFIGSWRWTTAEFFALLGGIHGLLASCGRRLRVKPQQIELRVDDLSIHGSRNYSMRYDELRGYSFIWHRKGAAEHRLLILYPKQDSAFSIGLAPDLTEEQIHPFLRDVVPYLSFIDDQAVKLFPTRRPI